ncbi:MAG: acyl--CoA ligase [Burkholderiales bacterium]|nr:acyl--CoA ligase [Burkholderiales bacterium]
MASEADDDVRSGMRGSGSARGGLLMAMRAPYSRNLFDLVREQGERYPAQAAVIAGDAHVTYAQLAGRAGVLAASLRALGVGRDDRVGLLLNNRVEWIEICLAAAALGAVPVPFSTWSTRREIDFLLADSGVRVLFTLDRFGERDYAADLGALLAERGGRYPLLERVIVLGAASLPAALAYAELADAAPLPELPPGERARDGDIAFVLYTSGSTAHPKAVPLTHGAAIENGFHIGERQGLVPGDRVLLPLPLFWSYGSANALCATLTHGAALVLQARFEPAGAIDLIERHACTSIYTLPAVTAAILADPAFRRERTASLRAAMTIGTPQDVAAVAEGLGAREVCNIYGQTESYGNCCVTWHDWPLQRRMHCQGPPLPGVRVRIVDAQTGALLPRGAIGSIEVRGYLTPGYAGASAGQNAAAFTADGYFRTGDLGLVNADGDLEFKARDSEMIKRAGINIAPAEVEEVLRQHPGVAAAGVAGAPHPEKGEIIVAFVVPTRGAAVDGDALRRHCRTLAATYKTPDRVEICDALPVTITGKLLRRELKQMAAAIAANATGDRP